MAYKPEKMDDDQLMSLIYQEISSGDYEGRSALKEQNADIDLMFANQFTSGTQPNTGLSSVLASTINPAVETLTSYQVNIFCSNDETVVFTSNDPEKVELAKEVTSDVNRLIHYENPGYNVLSQWLMDGFMHGTGIVQVLQGEKMKYSKEVFEGTEEELKVFISNKEAEGYDVTILDKKDTSVVAEISDGDVTYEITEPSMEYTLKLAMVDDMPTFENVPPEEFLINEGAISIHNDVKTRFVCRFKTVHISDLMDDPRFDNVDREVLYSLTHIDSNDRNFSKAARNDFDDTYHYNEGDALTGAMRSVELVESFIRADRDGDGIAEWRHCFSVGTTLLYDEEWFGALPFCHFTPFTVPHKFYGLKIREKLKGYHIARTALLRAGVDTAVLRNIYRLFADPRHVSLVDLKKNRHGVVPVGQNFDPQRVMHIPGPNGSPSDVVAMLQYLDEEVSAQIGLNYRNGVISADVEKSGNDAAKTQMAIDAASARIEKYARDFAETGLTNLVWLLYEYEKQRGELPEGLEKSDLKVKVGLGHQTSAQKLAGAQAILQAQLAMEQSPASPVPVPYKQKLEANLALAKALGYEDAARFFPSEEDVAAEQQRVQQQQMQMMQLQAQAQQADGARADADSEAKRKLEEAKAIEAGVKAQGAARKQELEEEAKVAELENIKRDNELNERRQAAQEEQMRENVRLAEQNQQLQRELAEIKAATELEKQRMADEKTININSDG